MRHRGADWLTLGGDNRRTGVSPHIIEPPLRMLWRCKDIQYPRGGIVVSGNMAVCISWMRRSIYGVNVRDGRVVWSYHLAGGGDGTPVISGECVYTGTASCALCLDLATGEERWRTSSGGRSSRPRAAVDACPLCIGGLVIYCDEETAAFDAQTGKVAFRVRSGNEPAVNMGPCSDGGSVYLIEGRSISRWSLQMDGVRASARTQGKPTAGPVIGDGLIIYGSSWSLVEALDAQTLESAWAFTVEDALCYEFQGWVESAPAFCNGRVFFGSPDGNVYALDGRTGKRLWKHQTEAPVESSPVVSGDTVYVMTAKKGLCAFSVDKGTLEWQHGFGDERIEYAPNLAVTDSTILCGAECLYAFSSTCESAQSQRTTGEMLLPVEEEAKTSDILPSKHRKTVMVSVVCYYDLLPQYLESLGFTKADRIDVGEVDLEVTGGYSSYLMGDEGAGGSHASVFAGCSYDFSPDTALRKGSIYFGMHTHKNRSQMLGDCPIGHFIGPEDDVFELLQQIIGDPWAELHLGSFPGDLEVASLWWTDRRYVRDCTGMGDAKG